MFKNDFEILNSKAVLVFCFDFGFKKIGLAKGVSQLKTATPLDIIKSKNNKTDWQKIDGLIKAWKPDFFVIGMPILEVNKNSNIAQAIRGFSKKLFGRYGKICILVDESYSSLEAESNLRELGIKSEEYIDADAACVILESFFNSHTNIVNIFDAQGWRIRDE